MPAAARVTTAARGMGWPLRIASGLGMAAFSLAPIRSRRRRGRVIETFRLLAHDAAADESLEGTQLVVVFGSDKADRVAHRVRAARAPDAVDV